MVWQFTLRFSLLLVLTVAVIGTVGLKSSGAKPGEGAPTAVQASR